MHVTVLPFFMIWEVRGQRLHTAVTTSMGMLSFMLVLSRKLNAVGYTVKGERFAHDERDSYTTPLTRCKSNHVESINTWRVRISPWVLRTSATLTLVLTNASRLQKSRTRNNSLKSKKSTGNDPTAGQRIKASSHLEEKNKQEDIGIRSQYLCLKAPCISNNNQSGFNGF